MTEIYFIPGTMCDQRLWKSVWNALLPLVPSTVKLIHLPIPLLQSIEAVTDYLSKQLPEKSLVVGFSLGGYLASHIALKFPHKIAQLMLVSNMSSEMPTREKKERMRTIQWIQKNGYTGIPDKRINHLLDVSARQNTYIKETIRLMDEALGKHVLLNQLNLTIKRDNLLPSLFSSPCPITFCVGNTDCFVNLSIIQTLINKTESTNKHLTLFNNTGHMLPLEQPEALAKTISQWLIKER